MESDPTVLIVDDEPAARASMAALVSSHGLPVKTFESAEEFLAAYDPAERGCLITDVRMPGMNGLELQQRLRERGATLPVIVITGFADIPLAVRAMQAGAVTFLEKPCADKELWQSLQSALDADDQAERDRRHRAEIVTRRASLAPAEVDVLTRMLAGKPNKQIAAELGCGLRTVELRRATVMKKMKAESLPELVRLVLVAEGQQTEDKSTDEAAPPSESVLPTPSANDSRISDGRASQMGVPRGKSE
jgi:FixJ family two-component response regulator